MQLHGSPWDESGFSTLESQGDPPDERGWDLQLDLVASKLCRGRVIWGCAVERCELAGDVGHGGAQLDGQEDLDVGCEGDELAERVRARLAHLPDARL